MSGQVEQMIQQELLLPEEAEAVEPEKIATFFKSEIGARAARAEKLFKETEFNLLKEVDGSEVMCNRYTYSYFEEAEHLILIDYKNSYIDPTKKESALEQLKNYLCGSD